jgi:1,2-phenylacetyl-CoA epoxidase PaaB subunit
MASKHPKRPRDVNQWAKRMVDIATGQAEDREPTPEEQGKDPAAAALGRKGGAARAKTMTKEQRSEIAKKAAQKRWAR